jgi:endoglucanase
MRARPPMKLPVALGVAIMTATVLAGTVASTVGTTPAAARPYPRLTYIQLSRVMDGERAGPPIGSLPAIPSPKGAACQAPYGWLTTSGKWVVEAANPSCKIRLTGVTWYGMQTTNYTFAGLNFESYKAILDTISALGMNSVRIPFANNVIETNPTVKNDLLKANPDLQGDHALDILNNVIAYAKSINLMVILDDHFAIARSASDTRNGVMSIRPTKTSSASPTPGITRSQWVSDWVMLANRYLNDDNVVGFDLFNEPHTQYPVGQKGVWTLKNYLQDGATWGPCTQALCGANSNLLRPGSDWPSAAEAAGNAVLAVNPHLLMFVEGVQLYPDPTASHYVEPYWWGSILKGVATDPVVFDVPNQLVYSPHEWGPWKCCGLKNEFNYATSYKSITKIFNQNWGYILNSKLPNVKAPIWLGEFDTCNSAQLKTKWTYPIKTAKSCYADTRHGSQGQWFTILIQYLQKNPSIGWSYYPLNASNALDQASNNSLLGCLSQGKRGLSHNCKYPWKQARLPGVLADLKTIE